MILVCKYSLERETGFKNNHFVSRKGNDMGAPQKLGILPSKWKSGKASGESNAGSKMLKNEIVMTTNNKNKNLWLLYILP